MSDPYADSIYERAHRICTTHDKSMVSIQIVHEWLIQAQAEALAVAEARALERAAKTAEQCPHDHGLLVYARIAVAHGAKIAAAIRALAGRQAEGDDNAR